MEVQWSEDKIMNLKKTARVKRVTSHELLSQMFLFLEKWDPLIYFP